MRTPYRLGILSLDGERRAEPIAGGHESDSNAHISPDGRWLAYESNESGRAEVYVRPYAAAAGGKRFVSDGGGTAPVWARTGRELFYFSADGRLVALAVRLGPDLEVGDAQPTPIRARMYFSMVSSIRHYDVAPDASRFLMIKSTGGTSDADAGRMIVVENWFQELSAIPK